VNKEDIRDLAESGDFQTLFALWKEYVPCDDQRAARNLELSKASKLRLIEWGVARAIDRARESGRIAKHGGSKDVATLESFGIPIRWVQDIRRNVPGHVSYERMVRAIDEAASAEGTVSRRAIGRALTGTEVEHDRPEALRGTLRHRPDRIIQSTVETLRGLCDGIDMLTSADFDSLESTEIAGWAAEIYECRRIIGKLHKELNTRA